MPAHSFTDNEQKAFDFAQDATKQLITLATGVIALTVTFLHDIAGNSHHDAIWLHLGWVSFVVSIVLGIATLQLLTGNMHNGTADGIYANSIRLMSASQSFFFLVAVGLTIFYAWAAS
jgi:hypothetical protein